MIDDHHHLQSYLPGPELPAPGPPPPEIPGPELPAPGPPDGPGPSLPVDGPGESSKGFSELHLSNHSFIILYDSVVCVDIARSLFWCKKY
jgi:hypothetical protein